MDNGEFGDKTDLKEVNHLDVVTTKQLVVSEEICKQFCSDGGVRFPDEVTAEQVSNAFNQSIDFVIKTLEEIAKFAHDRDFGPEMTFEQYNKLPRETTKTHRNIDCVKKAIEAGVSSKLKEYRGKKKDLVQLPVAGSYETEGDSIETQPTAPKLVEPEPMEQVKLLDQFEQQ